MRSRRVPLSELEQPCGRCNHQNAAHTGGAQKHGWAVYDETWANATGWCEAPGCECLARGAGELAPAEEARLRALRDAARVAGGAAVSVDIAAEVFADSEVADESADAVAAVRGSVPAVTPSVVESSPATRSGFPMWYCPPNGHANDTLRATCKWCGAHRPCEHWDGKKRCGKTPVHMYTNGPRCDPHSPRALRTSRETSPNRMEQAA